MFSRGDCAGDDCDRDSDSDCAGSEQVQRWCRASGVQVQVKRCRGANVKCVEVQMHGSSQEQIRILAKLASTGVKVDSFSVPTYVCYSTSLLVLIISDFLELT